MHQMLGNGGGSPSLFKLYASTGMGSIGMSVVSSAAAAAAAATRRRCCHSRGRSSSRDRSRRPAGACPLPGNVCKMNQPKPKPSARPAQQSRNAQGIRTPGLPSPAPLPPAMNYPPLLFWARAKK